METPRAWVHLHLPRFRAARTSDVISLKIPGRHIEYRNFVVLRDVEFKVHERGRQRCIREGVRNVHAWVVGRYEHSGTGDKPDNLATASIWRNWATGNLRRALYDPWKGGTFVDAVTLEPVTFAREAVCVGKDVFYRI